MTQCSQSMMSSGPWADEENDLIVADYFSMLVDDLSENLYNKSEHRRQLQLHLQRPHPSIEYKHRNISAVLKSLGEDWISGYKPAFNVQNSLIDAVDRWLAKNSDWLHRPPKNGRSNMVNELKELWVGPSPTLSNQPPPDELDQMLHIARKFDVASRDERNRALGRAGEELALSFERNKLKSSGREDLARQVRWVSEEDGDGAGYDIHSFELDGKDRLLEVKTTNGWERTPFHISRNELAVAEERRSEWCLFRLHGFSRKPGAFELRPPLETHVSLTPTSFQASFQ